MKLQTLIDVLTRINAPDATVCLSADTPGTGPVLGVRVIYNADGDPTVTVVK